MKIVNQNGRETTSLSATNAKQKSKYHEKEISIIKQMVSASLSGVSASHMVAEMLQKDLFLWYQNIFLFNLYKFLYSGQKKLSCFRKSAWWFFFASIKYIYIIWYLYFYSIKVNLYLKRNNFFISYNLFFIQLKYFFIIWIFHLIPFLWSYLVFHFYFIVSILLCE